MSDEPQGIVHLSLNQLAHLLQLPDALRLLRATPTPDGTGLVLELESPEFPRRASREPVEVLITSQSQLVGSNRWDHLVYATLDNPDGLPPRQTRRPSRSSHTN